MKVRAKKTPEWESELWSLVSRGDGERCPLDDRCRIRKECSWCVSEHSAKINQLFEERQFNVAKCDFIKAEPKRLGKPFRLVEMLAQRYLRKGKNDGPPVSAELIKQLDISPGIEIRPLALKAYHGAVWHLKDGWVIHLNSGDKPARQRVTLFHEVFHILAHYRATPVFRKRGIKEGLFNEMLADYFAGCILMPKGWVKEKWAEINDLKQIAKIFQVTEVLMWIRLKTIGLI